MVCLIETRDEANFQIKIQMRNVVNNYYSYEADTLHNGLSQLYQLV